MNRINIGLYAEKIELHFNKTVYMESVLHFVNSISNWIPVNSLTTTKETFELEAIYSSEVEGYFATRRDLTKFINKERTPNTKDEKVVYANYLALQHALDNSSDIFSKQYILELNSIIRNDTIIDYRLEEVCISNSRGDIVHKGIPYLELEKYMNDFIQFAEQSDLEPLLTSIILHFYFVYIHPFEDGNGRTGRAYSYAYLLNKDMHNFSLFSISYMLPDRRKQYYKELYNIEHNGYDLTNFIEFILRVMYEGLIDIKEQYRFTRILDKVRAIYEMFNYEYTDITEQLLQFINDKPDFSISNFLKKNKSRYIRKGLTKEQMQYEVSRNIENLTKHGIIDTNYKLQPDL